MAHGIEPPAGGGRNIVVCCDGTSNEVATDSTNVLRLFRALAADDGQIGWYDPGVGATPDPTKLLALSRSVGRLFAMAAGASVRANACRAYRYLSETWRPGDRIWLFGFSRGAYTIRAVAGMVRMLGLTRPEHAHLDHLAWTIYAGEKTMPIAARFGGGSRFAETFSWPATVGGTHAIHFLGAWDTVSAFGAIWDLKSLPFTADNPTIRHVRHAVSIDERRSLFQANLFHPERLGQHDSFKERWFAGSHGDVGGGWPEKHSGLAKIALEWMFDEAARLGCRFDADKRRYFLGQPSPYETAARTFFGGPDEPERQRPPTARVKAPPSVTTPVNDPFTASWTSRAWYLLECLPRRSWDGRRMRWRVPNLGCPRPIPGDAVLHPSVREKTHQDPAYRPRNLPPRPTFAE